MPSALAPAEARFDRHLPVALAVGYAVAGSVSSILRAPYELDPDEGYNLMKVMLVRNGHALYSDVWSDQPPTYTYLGVLAEWLLGHGAQSVRLLSVLLTAALVFALADLVRREHPQGLPSRFACVACVLLLPLGARFRMLSMAAMIGLPAVAFALLALWAVLTARSRPWRLALAGLFAGLSLTTKLFTLFLVPLLLALVVWGALRSAEGARTRDVRRAFREVSAFALALGATLGVLFWPLLVAGNLSLLSAPHGGARSFEWPELTPLFARMLPDLWAYACALAGLVWAVRKRSVLGVALGSWLLLAFVVLSSHRPLWFHHLVLLWVPTCGLAGLFGGYLLEWLGTRAPERLRSGLVIAAIAPLVAFDLAFLWPYELSERGKARRSEQLDVEASVRSQAPCARSIVTSRQMYAYRLGLEVPPELAVTSDKRFSAGELDAERIVAIMARDRPDVVVFDNRWKDSIRDTVQASLAGRYRLVYSGALALDVRVYLRSDLSC